MNHLPELYRYEVKKILNRKLVWITLLVCTSGIVCVVLSGLTGRYYVDGQAVDTHYHMFQVDQEYSRALSGRKIDQQLLEETMEAYGQIPPTIERYTLTEEYQTFARPYSAIFQLVWSWTGSNPLSDHWTPDEERLYAARVDSLENTWQNSFLSDAEKEFWREKEAQIHTPFTWFPHEGYTVSLQAYQTVGFMMLFFIMVSLSGVFPEEHIRRTDQLMLSSAKGKSTVYWAKIFAGTSVAAVCSLWMAVLTVTAALGAFGTEGYGTVLQLSVLFCSYSYPLTIGQACLLAYVIFLVTAIFAGLLVMVLSEALHSGIAALAVSAGCIILGMMLHIPGQYRIASQIWDYLPMTFLSPENIFDVRLITIWGRCFTSWQVVPVLYILCGILTAVIGKRIYSRYQVSGR